MKRIFLIAGARPNFMKVAPIMRELDRHKDEFEAKLIHTGQHYDNGMSEVFFQELGIPEPDYNLGVGSETHGKQVAACVSAAHMRNDNVIQNEHTAKHITGPLMMNATRTSICTSKCFGSRSQVAACQ